MYIIPITTYCAVPEQYVGIGITLAKYGRVSIIINKVFKVANIHTCKNVHILSSYSIRSTLVSVGLGWCINDLQLLIFKLVDIALMVLEMSWLEFNVNLTALHRPNTNFWTGSDQAIKTLLV